MPLPQTQLFFLNSTLISIKRKDKKKPDLASGFFYRHDGCYYVITNRHVVESDDSTNKDEREDSNRIESIDHEDVFIYIRHDKQHEEKPTRESIDIIDADENPLWISPSDPRVDVAAIPLEFDLGPTSTGAYSKHDFVPNYLEIFGGDQIMAVGYPKGLYDANTYLPVIRNGLIATPFKVDYKNRPMFLMDAKMHDGTSGSPVLTQPSPVQRSRRGVATIDRPRAFLLGIHSGPEHTPEPGDETEDDCNDIKDGISLELNMVWRIDIVEEMLTNI